jgi:hypothetical protein
MMGDAPAFVIKGGVPLETRVSLLSHKRARLEYKLNESCRKEDHLILPSIKPVPLIDNVSMSYFSRSEMIDFE